MARAPVFLAFLCLAASALAGGADARKMVGVYVLKKGDFSVKITNWGSIIMSIVVPDSKGNLADVVLGKDTIAEYVNDTSYFGPLNGRVAQRMARGRFVLDGKVYHTYINDGRNAIHGGHRGFSKVIWTVKEYVGGGDSPYITLYYRSFDGEQGFPGDLDVYATYELSGPYVLSVRTNATALNKATPVNFLQHTYWNLGGHGSGDVLGHTLQLSASRYTPMDEELLPSSGRVVPVAGTPYDFRAPTPIGARIAQVTGGKVVGYDINYVIDGEDPHAMRKVAAGRHGASGRALELWANQPAMQLYTGNYLNHTKGKGGKVYEKYGGFALETQAYPDAGPQKEPSQSGSNVSKLLLGTLVVGAAAMAAYQAGYIDLQFKDRKLPSTIRDQNVIKMYENLKTPSEQKVEQKQIVSDPNIDIVQDSDSKVHTPKNLPTEGMGAPETPTTGEQPTPAEEKGTEMLTQRTLPVPDEHGTDSKMLSQDASAVDIKPTVVNDKAIGEVPPGQADNIGSRVSPAQSSSTKSDPHHDSHTDTDAPKDPLSAGAVEQKSLAETYLLQDEPDITKDVSVKEPRSDVVVGGKASDDGKIVFDIIEAIHAAEKKQADTDAYMYSEEKRKLKEKYEKDLKDTRARELMYAEEAAILDKELKKEKLKSAAAIKELQEKAEQKLREELQRKGEEASQQVEKVQELAKAELAAALAKEKASQIEQIAEANLNIDALCMAFYARSEEARQSHSVHKLALGTLAFEQALSSGSPIRTEVDLLRKSLEGIDKDSLLELALSSLPEDVLEYGSDTRMELKQKFNSSKETIRHFSLIPSGGGGGILTHAVAHVASSIKIKEDQSGDGIESLISRVEDLIVDGDLSAAADALKAGLHGSEAEEIATEWVKQARKRAIAEQTLTLLHSYASSITFS